MSRKITIDPITRIEGHARVEIEIDDNNKVKSSVFKVIDFRGWETFLKGMQVENLPTITTRICGTCPASHHLASAKTVDKVFGVEIPAAAKLLRVALNLGATIHSHGVHFFALAGPDLLLGIDSDPSKRNIVGLVQAAPEVAKKALTLRSVGQRVVELIGGRCTHPVSCVVGGMAAPLGKEGAEKLKALSKQSVELGLELVAFAKQTLFKNKGLLEALPLKTHYLGTVNRGALDLYDGMLRLGAPDGIKIDFPIDDWQKRLVEETAPHSYAKTVMAYDSANKAVPYRVGTLARINVADKLDTPMAQAELEEFRKVAGNPCHQTVMYHWARVIELLWCVEKLAVLANDPEIASDNVRAKAGAPRNACAHVEAPRGVLIHDYHVDSNAIVTAANLLVATQQNISAINATVGLSAQKFIDQSDAFLLNAIEVAIRCYDPCLSCATHRVGEMKLDVVVQHDGRVIRRARR